MNPALSVVLFTVWAGAAQGLVVTVAWVALAGGATAFRGLLASGLWLATALLAAALAASFAHLGRPERAWRAAAMWRTSWLSREVIVLPAFAALVATWAFALGRTAGGGIVVEAVLPLAAIALAFVLWWCTAMIYACLRFVEEWSHRGWTTAMFVVAGLASGSMLAGALADAAGEVPLAATLAPGAIATTVLAGVVRALITSRNARLRHRSTAQSATGIRGERVAQLAMGMSGGSFNTREFLHGRSAAMLLRVRIVAFALGYAVPAAAATAATATSTGATLWWWLAVGSQAIGLVADRWLFFADAKHPQNLYYQVVS